MPACDVQCKNDVTLKSNVSGVSLTYVTSFFGRNFEIFASKLCDLF